MRQSPSGRRLGAFGFARLLLTAPAAYTDGVDKQIPFDTIEDQSEGFGELVVGGILSAAGAFRLSEGGIYLVNTNAVLSNSGTGVQLGIFLGATGIAGIASTATAVTTAGNCSLASGVAAPGADVFSAFAVTGASGNIERAECLIVQVG